MPSLLSTLLDWSLVLAGHGYDFRGSPTSEAGGGDEGGGLGTEWIVAAVVIMLVAVVVMAWLNRSEADVADASPGGTMRLKSVMPAVFTVAVIAAPLVIWTTSSGGDEQSLIVERWTSTITGQPELLVSLGEDDLNERKPAGGAKTVRITCRGRQGQSLLDARQKFPFIKERGYEYPHAHQAATEEQVQRADRCRLTGLGEPLEAEVEGKLKD